MDWRRAGRAVAGAISVLSLAGCAIGASPAQLPAFRSLGVQPGDEIKFDSAAEAVTVSIASERGIGSVEIERLGVMPADVALHLHLRGLEELRLSWPGVEVTVHLSSLDGVVTEELALTPDKPALIDPASPYWMPIRIVASKASIPLSDGYFEAVLPPALLRDAPERFSLRWIDFYR